MNTDKKGWLENYFNQRNELIDNQIKSLSNLTIEQLLYSFLQPTGFIYGYPVEKEDSKIVTVKDRLKLLLAEGFINTGLLLESESNPNLSFQNPDIELLRNISIKAGNYMTYVFPELAPKESFFQKKLSPLQTTEYMLDKVVDQKSEWKKFWVKLLDNSLLFLDVIFFGKWIRNEENIRESREETVITLLKTVAAAANADNEIKEEELKLYEHFVNSTHLVGEKLDLAKDFIHQQITLEQVDLKCADTWILKKYLLELAILTIWTDKEVEENEDIFIRQLTNKLGLDLQELDSSMIGIENFVTTNWQNVDYLHGKREFASVSKRLQERLLKVLVTNKDKLVNEIRESKELVQLLAKSAKQDLTAEEKAKVKTQLFDILKTIPALAIFMIPMGSLIFTLLLQVIPKKVLIPSSFID